MIKVLSSILSFKKLYVVVAIVASLLVLGNSILSTYEKAGYDRAMGELKEQYEVETKKAIKKVEKELSEYVEKTKKLNTREKERVEEQVEERVKMVEVIKYVDKIKIHNDCARVDSSVTSLLNDSINNSNKSSR